MSGTPFHPFVNRTDRQNVTSEPDCKGSRMSKLNPGLDWIGFQDRGGGRLPADLRWTTNPKQYQEENGGGEVSEPPKP